MTRIITDNIRPPIPTRSHDWCAYYDGCEEDQEYGYGATEAEAIADLKANYDDPEDCCGMCHSLLQEGGFCPSCKEAVA